jgi:predicted nuclease of predicted toxin-antitoxin system
MANFLANENVPGEVVEAARLAGHEVAWIGELSPGADDDAVFAVALAESRVLLTFDKDFGDMAFRQGKTATCEVVLFRPRVRSRSQRDAGKSPLGQPAGPMGRRPR